MLDYLVFSLSELIVMLKHSESGMKNLEKVLEKFSCREKDVENFLRYKAIKFEEIERGKTFLIINNGLFEKEGDIDVVAFFTTGMTTLDLSNLSKNKRKVLLGGHPNHDNIPAFLIGQLGRNKKYSHNELSGKILLKECFSQLKEAQKVIGIKNVVIECKSELIPFYEAHGFGVITALPDENKLHTLYRRL